MSFEETAWRILGAAPSASPPAIAAWRKEKKGLRPVKVDGLV
jgi:hypothetical protein